MGRSGAGRGREHLSRAGSQYLAVQVSIVDDVLDKAGKLVRAALRMVPPATATTPQGGVSRPANWSAGAN
jgi:hypothetical protein